MAMRRAMYLDDDDPEEDSIPLADDDPDVLLTESEKRIDDGGAGGLSLDSIPSVLSDEFAQLPSSSSNSSSLSGHRISAHMSKLSQDFQRESQGEVEEKARLISQVLELQNTLDDLTNRVDVVKEENLKLRTENNVLGQYIENLMQASAVFQAVTPGRSKAKPRNLGTVIRVTARAVQEAAAKE